MFVAIFVVSQFGGIAIMAAFSIAVVSRCGGNAISRQRDAVWCRCGRSEGFHAKEGTDERLAKRGAGAEGLGYVAYASELARQ